MNLREKKEMTLHSVEEAAYTWSEAHSRTVFIVAEKEKQCTIKSKSHKESEGEYQKMQLKRKS